MRQASLDDVERIAELSRDYENGDIREVIKTKIDQYIVEGDPIHGFIRSEPFNDKLLVTQVIVAPEFQRSGVGTRLLGVMDDIAKLMGLTGVVNCGPKTPAITKLYEKLGYEEIDRIPNAWGEGKDAIILFKEVTHD